MTTNNMLLGPQATGGVSNGPSLVEQQQALQVEKDSTFNQANSGGLAAETSPRRRRIPLSVPRRRLEVAPIPGMVLYWFKESNISVALDAGYDFVDRTEVSLNQVNEANPSDSSGNTDLGSRVSIVAGTDERGLPERLVLMKIREDWWREDREVLDSTNAEVIQSIFGRGVIAGATQGDHSQSYVRTNLAQGSGKLFNRGLKKVTG